MHFYNKIINLDIENSSICNANCPQCLRETFPGNYNWFKQTYLTEDFFNRIPNDVYQGLQKILFSGTMGDPCAAPNFLNVIDIVRNKNQEILIKISTNGGMKTSVFWSSLAEKLGNNSEVIFAIDGLQDTNHIYRMNVNWNALMKNSQAFISAGGNATWQFIVFKHNQHQVEQARVLSQQLGFKNFIMVPSHRFNLDNILGRRPVGGQGVLIEPPTRKEFQHSTVSVQPLKKIDVNEWLSNSQNCSINCYAKKDLSLYIDSQGNVFPCCFLGANLYSRVTLSIPDGWDKLWETEGKKSNLYTKSWEEIISSVFFKEIENSWDGRTYSEGRLAGCAANCGDFDGRINDPNEFDGILKKANAQNNQNTTC